MHRFGVDVRAFRIGLVAFAAAGFLSLGGVAKAGDREDAKALVGKWKEHTFFLPDEFEFKADGTSRAGFIPWTVRGGKLVITNIEGKDTEYTYTLSPDGQTLRYDGKTYKRR